MRTLLTIALTLSFFLVGCGEDKPIKVGFMGSLSGRDAEVSQAARNGTILAVEILNLSGGINGRQVELLIFDDENDQNKAREGVKFLSNAGAAGIIGPITSQMAVAAVPEANQQKIVLVSPTTSTVDLTGKVDHFFRTISTCEANARRLAIYAAEKLGAKRFSILQDASNIAFTQPWQHCFSGQIELSGGEIVAKEQYNSLEKSYSFLNLAEKLLRQDPDAILVLANSIDAAMFSQQVEKLAPDIPLLGSDWSSSGNLIQYGGRSVEGFTFTTNLDMDSKAPRFIRFKEDYSARFGATPMFPSVLAYEASLALFKALTETQNPEKVAKSLTSIGTMEGLQVDLRMDSYGDIVRATYINEVKNGKMVCVFESTE